MNQPVNRTMALRAQAVVKQLQKRNMDAYYVPTSAEAVSLVRELLPAGASVAVGGSVTLAESGVLALLQSGGYRFIDRTASEEDDYIRAAATCDAFFMSSNAVTEDGKLFNIDGTGSRLAFLVYGPKSVYVIAGVNKLVKDLDAAHDRLKRVASPANALRLERETPCARAGVCADCRSPQRICCSEVTTTFQRRPGRVKVILVGEELGF